MSPEQMATTAYGERLDADLSGIQAGPYFLEKILGRGGGGTVYQAVDASGVRYALKVLRPQAGSGAELLLRFSREIQTLRELQHPNIVRIVDSGTIANSWPFFAMELLDGCTLRDLLKRHQRLSVEECLEVLQPIVSALSAAHADGIVHRDLKASNVFVSGDPPVIKLIDFGVAKLIQPDEGALNLTTYGTQIGTIDSMSPEQIRCEPVDERTDVYALGVLMYQMLTGHLPYHGMTPEELMQAHLYEPPPRPSWVAPVSPAVDAVVLRCLQKRPTHRYESAMAVLRALLEAVDGNPGSVSASTGDPASLGLYVEAVELAEDEGDEDDGWIEDALLDALDNARNTLADLGFSVVLELGNSLVAMMPLPAPETMTADGLLRVLAPPEGPVGLRLVLHAATAQCEQGQLVGGALADLHAWVPRGASLPGVHVTDEARAWLPQA